MREVLLSTPHGSRLYGMHHATSDYDTYTVVAREAHAPHNGRAKFARQVIHNGHDTFVVDLSTFMHMCEKGVPQALEAMYSPEATVDLIGALRAGYRVSTPSHGVYLRTIKAFHHAGTVKQRRHAVRLALNLRDIRAFGFFNPVLTPAQVEFVKIAAEWDHTEIQDVALS